MKNKPQQSLKSLLQKHYGSQELEDSQIANLLDRQAKQRSSSNGDNPLAPSHWFGSKRLVRQATVSFCVLALALVLWTQLRPSTTQENLVEEIAQNHLQPLELDSSPSSFEAISQNLSHLSFSLVIPERLSPIRWKLLGGRYCTLQGKLAAQLQLLDKQSQKIVTLYQSAMPFQAVNDISTKTLQSNAGVEISIWWQDGVMLALAQ